MTQKMIFFDIDGTIMEEGTFRIPNSTKEALAEAHNNGHLLFVNTGRTFAAVDDEVRALPFDGYVTGCGTYIYYHGEQLLANPLSPKTCRSIAENLRKWKLPVFYEGDKELYYDPQNPTPKKIFNLLLQNFKRNSFAKVSMDETFSFDKLLVFPNETSDWKTFLSYIQKDFVSIDRGEGLFEIIQAPFSKATGISYLMEYLHIPLEDCYAIGDSTNDLPMLTFVPNSIAMGNSMKEILPYCSYQTRSITEDGIRHALEHFSIIECKRK